MKLKIRITRDLKIRGSHRAIVEFFFMIADYDRDITRILDSTCDYREAIERLNRLGYEIGNRFSLSDISEFRLDDVLGNNLIERFRNRTKLELNRVYGKECVYADTDSFWKLHSIEPFSDDVPLIDR